jgi:hypothetical protein
MPTELEKPLRCTITPLERPSDMRDKQVFTDEEAAASSDNLSMRHTPDRGVAIAETFA